MPDPDPDELVVTSLEFPENFFDDPEEEETMPTGSKSNHRPNGQFMSKVEIVARDAANASDNAMSGVEEEVTRDAAPSGPLVRRGEMGLVNQGDAEVFRKFAGLASSNSKIQIVSGAPEAMLVQIAATLTDIAPSFQNVLAQLTAGTQRYDDAMAVSIRGAIAKQLGKHAGNSTRYTDQTIGVIANCVGQELDRRARDSIQYTDKTVDELFNAVGTEFARQNIVSAQHTNNMVVGAYQDLSTQIAQYTTEVVDHANRMVTASHANLSTQMAQNTMGAVDHATNLFTTSYLELSKRLARNTVDNSNTMFDQIVATTRDTNARTNKLYSTLSAQISDQETQIALQTAEIAKQKNYYGILNARYEELGKQEARNATALRAEMAEQKRQFNEELAERSAQFSDLQAKYENLGKQVRKVPDAALSKKVAAQEAQYNDLQAKYDDLAKQVRKAPDAALSKKVAAQEAQYNDLQAKYDELAKRAEQAPDAALSEKITAQETRFSEETAKRDAEFSKLQDKYDELAKRAEQAPDAALSERIAEQEARFSEETAKRDAELSKLHDKYDELAKRAEQAPDAALSERIAEQEAQFRDLRDEFEELAEPVREAIEAARRERTAEQEAPSSDPEDELQSNGEEDYSDIKERFNAKRKDFTARRQSLSAETENPKDNEERYSPDWDEFTPPSSPRGSTSPSLDESNGETDMAVNDELMQMLKEDNARLKTENAKIYTKLDEMMEMLKKANGATKEASPRPSIETDDNTDRRPARPTRNKTPALSQVGDDSDSESDTNLRPWQKKFKQSQKEARDREAREASKTPTKVKSSSASKELGGYVVMNVEPGQEKAAERAKLRHIGDGIYACPPEVDVARVPDQFKELSTTAKIPVGSIILKTDPEQIVKEQMKNKDKSHTVKDCGGYFYRSDDLKVWVALPNLPLAALNAFPIENLPDLREDAQELRQATMDKLLNKGGTKDKASKDIELDVRKGEHIWMETLEAPKYETGSRTFQGKEIKTYDYYCHEGQDRTPYRTWDPAERSRTRDSAEVETTRKAKTRGNLPERDHTREARVRG